MPTLTFKIGPIGSCIPQLSLNKHQIHCADPQTRPNSSRTVIDTVLRVKPTTGDRATGSSLRNRFVEEQLSLTCFIAGSFHSGDEIIVAECTRTARGIPVIETDRTERLNESRQLGNAGYKSQGS